MIEARDISFAYHKTVVLRNVNFTIERGDFVALLGPNGSGKTTLLKIILGALFPTQGEVLLEGRPVVSYRLKEKARQIAYVSQQPFSSLPLTVYELVALGRYPYANRFKDSPEDQKAVEATLRATDCHALRERKFTTLSGGERQKVLISRALVQSSHLLLLDEPTVHLDIFFQLQILTLLRNLCRERQSTIIAVFHDVNLAALFADKALLLKAGKIHAFGKVNEVVQQRSIQELFGVKGVVKQDQETGTWYFLPRRPF